jgi:coenzyme PQQ precursor peptide PqqA
MKDERIDRWITPDFAEVLVSMECTAYSGLVEDVA